MGIGILSQDEVLNELHQPPDGPCRIWRPSQEPLDGLIDKSSIDLPLGDTYWTMKGSCRAGAGMKVASDLIPRFSHDRTPRQIRGDLTLERNHVYLFKADCELNLKDTKILGKATAKSSIGRLDVLVRLLCDRASEFDRLPSEYEGALYAEVTPITFGLIVRPGTCLSQLRLFRGTDRLVSMTREELLYEESLPVIGARHDEEADLHGTFHPFRLELGPDPECGCSGFVAKKERAEPIDPHNKGHYDPRDFWEPVEAPDGAIELKTDRLYILRSKEHLRIPGHMALECEAYTETMGEWRIEYAGFAHPWFGRSRPEGSPLIFEVRGHNIPTILTDGIPLGNVCFKRMSQPAPEPGKPEDYGQYEKQELKLSGCFKDWPTQES